MTVRTAAGANGLVAATSFVCRYGRDILGPHQGAWVGSVQLRDLRHSPGVCLALLMRVPTTVHTGGPEAESAGPDFTPVTTGRSEYGHMAVSSGIQHHRTPHTRPLEATSVLPVESLRVLLNNTASGGHVSASCRVPEGLAI